MQRKQRLLLLFICRNFFLLLSFLVINFDTLFDTYMVLFAAMQNCLNGSTLPQAARGLTQFSPPGSTDGSMNSFPRSAPILRRGLWSRLRLYAISDVHRSSVQV